MGIAAFKNVVFIALAEGAADIAIDDLRQYAKIDDEEEGSSSSPSSEDEEDQDEEDDSEVEVKDMNQGSRKSRGKEKDECPAQSRHNSESSASMDDIYESLRSCLSESLRPATLSLPRF